MFALFRRKPKLAPIEKRLPPPSEWPSQDERVSKRIGQLLAAIDQASPDDKRLHDWRTELLNLVTIGTHFPPGAEVGPTTTSIPTSRLSL